MRILLANDDGIMAPGILMARQYLAEIGEVFLVAPERQRSAAGHAITLHKPLRMVETALPDGASGFATNGTPADCVSLGVEIVMEGRCDLVVSGINSGSNLGWDLTYSGTVAAAFEGAVLNIPSIAISVASDGIPSSQIDYTAAAKFAARLAVQLASDPLPSNTFLNVNVPAIPEADIAGTLVTHQGKREYFDRIAARQDPSGRNYYWQGGSIRDDEPDPGSDVEAVLNNKISVSPIHLDLTAYSLLDHLRKWNL